MRKLKVTLVRGLAGKPKRQKATAKSLGLRKPRQVRIHKDTPMIKGMIAKIKHLVEVVELEDHDETS